MNVNINHPSFISFLDNVTSSILSNVTVENYFKLTPDKKLGVQYMVFKLMKNAVKVRAKLSDNELRSFVSVLWKKNEESENYEFAAILNDISQNFDKVNEVTKPIKRSPRTIKSDKIDKTNNG
jgi:hypothetical protein